jgi:AraC-like DNA-binding protein
MHTMNTTFLNIAYPVDDGNAPRTGVLVHSLWRVDVDESYEVFHPRGFSRPGIFITLDGEGEVICGADGDRHHFLPLENTLLAVDGGIPCRYRCRRGRRWRFHFVHFNDMAPAAGLGLSALRLHSVPDSSYARHLCESIIAESLTREEGYHALIDALFMQLLVTSRRMSSGAGRERGSAMKRVVHWIHANFDRDVPVEQLVTMSGLNRTDFFRGFREETGMSPSAYINNVRMRSARMILESSFMKNAEIAALLHFCDEYHFSKAFTRVCGMPPSRYRKLYNGTGRG